MTQTEWAAKSDREYKSWAREIAKHITIRTYIDGNSQDNTRESTPEEENAIYGILMGAMLAYGWRAEGNLDSILDTAEFSGHYLIPCKEGEVNCYDTIYIPLQKTMGEWV